MSGNYPPGVTGNEPQLTGEWPCENCGAVLPEDHDGNTCPNGCPEPDWDAERDRREER